MLETALGLLILVFAAWLGFVLWLHVFKPSIDYFLNKYGTRPEETPAPTIGRGGGNNIGALVLARTEQGTDNVVATIDLQPSVTVTIVDGSIETIAFLDLDLKLPDGDTYYVLNNHLHRYRENLDAVEPSEAAAPLSIKPPRRFIKVGTYK